MPMRTGVRNWIYAHRIEIALSAIFCFIGFIAGIATRWDLQWQISFDNKINPVELLSLASTVILVWVIASVLDKQKQAEASAKATLLKRVEDLHTFVHETAIKSASGNFLFTDAAYAPKRVTVTTERLCRLLESNQIYCDEKIKSDILVQAERMLDLMTSYRVQKSDDNAQLPVRVENDKVIFSDERALEIETAFDELKHRITLLELAIINA